MLKKQAKPIAPAHHGLSKLVADMWETMYNAHGVGLAAPQVGLSLRIFVVDTLQVAREEGPRGVKRVFINPIIKERSGPQEKYEEGCLSIPDVRGEVERPTQIVLEFLDEDFVHHQEVFDGLEARVIQHEYDHLEGVLFTEKLKPLRRARIKRKLEEIRKGMIDISYPMRFT